MKFGEYKNFYFLKYVVSKDNKKSLIEVEENSNRSVRLMFRG